MKWLLTSSAVIVFLLVSVLLIVSYNDDLRKGFFSNRFTTVSPNSLVVNQSPESKDKEQGFDVLPGVEISDNLKKKFTTYSREGNREYNLDGNGTKRMTSISGQLVKTSKISESLFVDVVYSGSEMKFQTSIVGANIIDNRENNLKSLSVEGFLRITSTSLVSVKCVDVLMLEEGKYRCGTLVVYKT